MTTRYTAVLATALMAALTSAGGALAQDAAQNAAPAPSPDPIECRKVVFSDVGWTDISATTALASTVLPTFRLT